MKTAEEYMIQFAQEHSYESWDELMNDCHDIVQIQYTKELLLIYAKDLLLHCATEIVEWEEDEHRLKALIDELK